MSSHVIEAIDKERLFRGLPKSLVCVETLKSDIESGITIDPNSPLCLLIIGVQRYFIDPSFSDITDICDINYTDSYDITLTDNRHKIKGILAPSLNHLVTSGRLLIGEVVFVTKWEITVDESDLHDKGLLIIHDVYIYESLPQDTIKELLAGSVLKFWDDIPWSPECSERERLERPLVTTRGSYVGLWSSYETDGEIWSNALETASDTETADITTIREVSRTWRTNKRGSLPSLLVRVMAKSRLLNFAKSHKSEKWPYQFQFSIADSTGSCTAVAWTSMCTKLYQSIKEGQLILISSYSVKTHFTASSRSILRNVEPLYDIDIDINPKNPTSTVKLVDESSIHIDSNFPGVQYNWLSLADVTHGIDNVICDVSGITVRVSRYERDSAPIKGSGDIRDSGSYYIYRGLVIYDGDQFMDVKLYRCAQPDLIDNIRPRSLLLLRNMRIVRQPYVTNLHNHRGLIYLTSTHQTQITILNDGNIQQYSAHIPNLADHLTLSKRSSLSTIPLVLGGIQQGPLFWYSNILSQVQEKDFKILQSKDWQSMVNNLSYKETRVLFVQAYIAHLNIYSVADCAAFYKNSWNPSQVLTEKDKANDWSESDQYPSPQTRIETKDGRGNGGVERVSGVKLALDQNDVGFYYNASFNKLAKNEFSFPVSKFVKDCRPNVTNTSNWKAAYKDTTFMTFDLLSLRRDLILPALCPDPQFSLSHLTSPQNTTNFDTQTFSENIQNQPLRKRWLFCLRAHRLDYTRCEVLVDKIISL